MPAPFKLDFPVTLTAVVTQEEGGGYSAEVPDLPGCCVEAETLEQLREVLRQVAAAWLQVHGEQLRELTAAPGPVAP